MADLTKDNILTIAKNHYASQLEYSISDGENCILNIYGVDTKNTWCVFIDNPNIPIGIKSSEVVVVSKNDGKVLYSGSANDEG